MRISIPPLRTGASIALLLLWCAACGEDAGTPATPQPAPAPTPPAQPAPPTVSPEVAAWLDARVEPFEGSHLSLPHDDLAFLRELVGDARIVALGENTHGTRDFFEMKARILRFLVEEMDFDTFAIEATWPEARRLDAYVRTGVGDPAVLLSGLYFWTWRTESVLEMIEWMRDHNEAGGEVGFHGVDMQYPGMALHLVREFIRFADPASVDLVTEDLDCLARFANEPDGRFPETRYGEQPAADLAECGASLEGVRQRLTENRERYGIAGGEDAYEIALRSLRVAYQYHLQATREQSRDESMAENTAWLSDRIGPEGRMVLWAHNNHVSTRTGAQGYYQRQAFGDDMVVIGFSHETGTFTAVGFEGVFGQPGVRYTGIADFELPAPIAESFEARFAAASAPRFVLDLRRPSDDPAGLWLSEPRPFRSIGCCFNPDAPPDAFYRQRTPLPEWYDAIIHFESTRPTTVLPRRTPSTW